MRLKEFTIGFSRTINLGSFESARVEAQATVEIHDDEDVQQAIKITQTTLRRLLEETWREQYKPRDKDGVIRR